jgi:hypothetical protein
MTQRESGSISTIEINKSLESNARERFYSLDDIIKLVLRKLEKSHLSVTFNKPPSITPESGGLRFAVDVKALGVSAELSGLVVNSENTLALAEVPKIEGNWLARTTLNAVLKNNLPRASSVIRSVIEQDNPGRKLTKLRIDGDRINAEFGDK